MNYGLSFVEAHFIYKKTANPFESAVADGPGIDMMRVLQI